MAAELGFRPRAPYWFVDKIELRLPTKIRVDLSGPLEGEANWLVLRDATQTVEESNQHFSPFSF